jgi:(2R)-sulfolactate sulfo-lyase subunit alpha
VPLHKFLVHRTGDHVGVAVEDIQPGEEVEGICMDTERSVRVVARDPIPLGHKIALADLAEGAEVIEYGVRIGLTRSPVRAGQHVHVHNIKSARW